MFEDNTYENLLDDMLSNVDDTIDTREGSIIHETLSPMALQNAQMYTDLDLVLDECFADTASYYYLIKRCAERGINVVEGTASVLRILVSPTDVAIEVGAQFIIGDLTYSVTENIGSGYYNLTCDTPGTAGNNTTDPVIPDEDIEGLESVTVAEIIAPGTEDESEESLRERYFDSFINAQFGGNKADYKARAKEYSSVYACKVYPVWNGGGTVKLMILGENYRAVTQTVIDAIQEAFDPTQDGTGSGIAPIGHIVTVDTATEQEINLVLSITYDSGVTWSDIESDFTTAFENYLLDLREDWEDEENLIVRMSSIEQILLAISGVDDVTRIEINGTVANLTIPGDTIPIGGAYSG